MKLAYFDSYGYAEAVRLLLTHAKVEFEDIRLKREDWPQYKADHADELEWGQVPALTHGDKHLTQTQSILRYLGNQYGYYPKDAFDAWRADSANEALKDLMAGFYVIAMQTQDEEKKKELFQNFLTTTLPTALGKFEKRL